jgi:uncharacterized protein YndB with AHSA1/START domain
MFVSEIKLLTPMDMNTKQAITVEAIVNAPISKVWESWALPQHITKWNQASEDWHTPYAENDLRTGGKFKSTMAAKDGSASFDFEGVYSLVIPQERIEYAMSDGRTVKVIFQGSGNQTKVTETFDPESENSLELQRGGWQAILNSFKKYTEEL